MPRLQLLGHVLHERRCALRPTEEDEGSRLELSHARAAFTSSVCASIHGVPSGS